MHAYCLVRNYFHLLIVTPQPNLAVGMKWLLGTYIQMLLGEWGIPKHSLAGRRVFEERMEWRRGEELRGEFKRVMGPEGTWRGCSNRAEAASSPCPQTNASWKYDRFSWACREARDGSRSGGNAWMRPLESSGHTELMLVTLRSVESANRVRDRHSNNRCNTAVSHEQQNSSNHPPHKPQPLSCQLLV